MNPTIEQIEVKIYAKRHCCKLLEIIRQQQPADEETIENTIVRIHDEINELKVQKARIIWQTA